MSEWFSSDFHVLPWFLILLSIGVMDGLIQLSDYLRWRKDRGESNDLID